MGRATKKVVSKATATTKAKKKTNGIAISSAITGELQRVEPLEKNVTLLSEERYGFLRQLKEQMDSHATRVTAVSLEMARLKNAHDQLLKEWAELDQKLSEGIKNAAKENNVDLENSRWMFTFHDLSFRPPPEQKGA